MKTQIDLTIVATMTLPEAEQTLARLVPSDPLFGPLSDAIMQAKGFNDRFLTTFTG